MRISSPSFRPSTTSVKFPSLMPVLICTALGCSRATEFVSEDSLLRRYTLRSSLCLSFFFSPELDFFLALGLESRLANSPPLFFALLAGGRKRRAALGIL